MPATTSGSAANKARQRARNASASGSSGISTVAGRMLRKEFSEVEQVAEHVGDLQALFQSGQIMANRAVTGTLVAQKEWAHEMLECALASQGRAVYIRFYVVPLGAVLEMDDDDEGTDTPPSAEVRE
jgi:hypothetical protein